jgi:uncharacterized protein YjbK
MVPHFSGDKKNFEVEFEGAKRIYGAQNNIKLLSKKTLPKDKVKKKLYQILLSKEPPYLKKRLSNPI